MRYVLEGNRLKIYDDKGNLVEERNANLDDLKNIILDELTNNYYIEFTFQIGTQTVKVTARLKKQ